MPDAMASSFSSRSSAIAASTSSWLVSVLRILRPVDNAGTTSKRVSEASFLCARSTADSILLGSGSSAEMWTRMLLNLCMAPPGSIHLSTMTITRNTFRVISDVQKPRQPSLRAD